MFCAVSPSALWADSFLSQWVPVLAFDMGRCSEPDMYGLVPAMPTEADHTTPGSYECPPVLSCLGFGKLLPTGKIKIPTKW